MKHIFKYSVSMIAIILIAISCDYDDTNFDELHRSVNENDTYYIRFNDSSKSLETSIDEDGLPAEIESTVEVVLLGTPLMVYITLVLTIDGSSTIESDMYSLSATSITIPAGKTSGEVILKSIASNMPEGETLKLVININDEHNATEGTQLNYDLLRIEFCPWTVDEMVGTYTGTDMDGYSKTTMEGAKFEIFKIDDTHIAVSGILQGLYSGVWGETATGGDRVVFEYKPNGRFVAENQHLLETDNVWDYYFGPSDEAMKWDGCSMKLTIPWFFHWDDAYGDNMKSLAVFTKD